MATVGNYIAVGRVIDEWRRAGPVNEALAEIALTLAGALDKATDRTVAPISKELRATLAELEPVTNDEPDDTDRFLESLRAKVGDTPPP